MTHTRHLLLEHAHNFRDLGGYPTTKNTSTKWGMLYRSDALTSLSDEEWKFLKEKLGIGLVIDLRSEKERQNAAVSPSFQIRYASFSLMKELDHLEAQPKKDASNDSGYTNTILQSMKLDYTSTLFGNMDCAVKILLAILDTLTTKDEAVVFLCSAGKDRTGIVAALILYLCSVPREDILADYMVSSTYNANGINRNLSSLPKELLDLIPDDVTMKQSLASDPETMALLLDAFDQKDIRRCLHTGGFTYEMQKELVQLITQP